MVEPLPTFDEVREQMRSPKPPVGCRVVEFDHGEVRRSATVLFDGLQGWYIDDGTQVEVRGSDECVLFDSDGTLERVGPGLGYVHSNAWAKTPIEPRRMLLDEARGRVLRRDEVNGRSVVVVEFSGLRRPDDDVVFEMQVDAATGVVLAMSRPDLGLVLRVDDLRVGSVEGR